MPLLSWNLMSALANPNTGDMNAGVMGIVIGVLVVSAIVLVVMGVTSKNKKKKRRK